MILEAVAAREANINAVSADVTDEDSMAKLHQRAESDGKAFDIVVANAGMASSAPAYRTPLADWRRTLEVNLTGAFLTVKPALAARSR